MEPHADPSFITTLLPGCVLLLTSEQVAWIRAGLNAVDSPVSDDCSHLELLQDIDSGMTGSILVFQDSVGRLLLEFDTKHRPYLRRLLPDENVALFVTARQEQYDRLWDG